MKNILKSTLLSVSLLATSLVANDKITVVGTTLITPISQDVKKILMTPSKKFYSSKDCKFYAFVNKKDEVVNVEYTSKTCKNNDKARYKDLIATVVNNSLKIYSFDNYYKNVKLSNIFIYRYQIMNEDKEKKFSEKKLLRISDYSNIYTSRIEEILYNTELQVMLKNGCVIDFLLKENSIDIIKKSKECSNKNKIGTLSFMNRLYISLNVRN